MNDADRRQILCEKCLLVKGFNRVVDFPTVRRNLPEATSCKPVSRTVAHYDKEWIVLFKNVHDVQKYVNIRELKCEDGILDFTACQLPCDIPDEWLKDAEENSGQHSVDEVQCPTYPTSPYQGTTEWPQGIAHSTSNPHPQGPNPYPYPYMQYSGPAQPGMHPSQGPYGAQLFFQGPQGTGDNTKQEPGKGQPPPGHLVWPQQHPYYPYQHSQYNAYPHGFNPNQPPGPAGFPHPDMPVGHYFPGYSPGFPRQGPGLPGQGPRFPQPAASSSHAGVYDIQPSTQPSHQEQSMSTNDTIDDSDDYVKPDLTKQSDPDVDNKEDEPKNGTTNMLKVTKLPPGTTEDSLLYFFENTRKFGGGDIKEVELDEGTKSAIITFEEEEAVDIVLNKMPIMFNKKVIEVAAHGLESEASSAMVVTEVEETNKDEAVSCTIEVKGMKKSTTEDTITYYFESKKGARADVENIQFIEDKNMYLVTFEDEEAVETVMSKTTHVVDGAELQVKRHVPPKRYPNKALVKDLDPSISKESIINYLEARTKMDVEDVEFGEENTTKAIVTFTDPIDIRTIQTACQKKQLEKCNLTIEPVFVTNCIVVRGFGDETSESSLEFYFDNKRKSGVEGIERIEMNEDEDYCVIYFEKAEDALKACQKTHTISGCDLRVQVFYDCLGVPADSKGSKFKPLPPLVLTETDIDTYKVKFLAYSATSREALEKQLLKVNCQIKWPSFKGDCNIVAECNLSKDVPECRKLAKTWTTDVQNEIKSFLDMLKTQKHLVLQEAWAPVMEQVRLINIESPEGVRVNIEKPPQCELIIVGYAIPVKDVSEKVKQIIANATEDLDRQKKTVHEEVHLKHFQLLILSFSNFKSKICQTFDRMEIKIDLKKLVIKFTGLSKNVNDAKVAMFETINQVTSAPIGMKSPGFIKFLKRNEVKNIVSGEIKKKGIVGVWDLKDNYITMYALSDEEAVDAANILKTHIVESHVDVDNFQKSALLSPKWRQYIDDLKDEYQKQSVIVDVETDRQGEITVYCTSKGAEGVIKEKINDFFMWNTEKDKNIVLPEDELKFLQEQMSSELDDLQKDLKKKHVTLVVKSDSIVIKGSPQGIKDAETEVDQLVFNIYKTKHSMDKPGLKDLVESLTGRLELKQVNQKAGVVVSLAKEGAKSAHTFGQRSSATDGQMTFIAAGGQKVMVVKVDITTLDVDVIVNAANEDLLHSGGLAKALISKGGKTIQDECNQHTRSHGKLSVGEYFSSGPGNLKCQIIVHTVGPVWQGGANGEENDLCICVEKALEETESSGLNSIAIPALCTGIFSYPPDKATSAIVKTVKEYFQSNASSCVQIVYLCDVNPKAVSWFERAGNKYLSGGTVSPSDGRHDSAATFGQQGPITVGNIKIKIIKGELSKMKVDVIVNTTSKDLSLKNGAVSATLLKAAGNAIQDECTKSYPKGVQIGEVAVTSGYNLLCQYVCHGCLDQWSPDGSAIQTLEKFIQECFSTATAKKCQSVALPAMGTGKLGYPKDLVAKHMYIAVKQFVSQNPTTSINEVLFVVYDKDHPTIKAFEDERRRLHVNEGGLDRGLTRKPTGYAGRKSGKAGKPKPTVGEKITATGGSEDNNEYSVNLGHLVFKVYQGDITEAKVDAIVNSTNPDLDFSMGAVSKIIQQKGGKELEAQLNKQRTKIKKSGIAVTRHATGLLCKFVIHIDMTGADANKVNDKVKLTLERAEGLKIATVAFPALGTSTTSNIPVNQIAEGMFKVVEIFNKKKTVHLKEVHVVIFQREMMKNFMGAIQGIVKKEKGYLEKWLGWTGLVGATGETSIKISRKKRDFSQAQTPINKWSSQVDFMIYAPDKYAADQAIVYLDKMVNDAYIERTVSARILKEFQDDQVKEAQKKLTEGNKVEVNIDTKAGVIKIKGMIRPVSDAVDLANEIINDAERGKQFKQRAKLVTDMVQWYYMEKDDKGKDQLVEYPTDVNLILESAAKDQLKEASFYDASGNKYIVDLNSYEEFPANDPTDKVQVLRKSKLAESTFVPPDMWDKMDEKGDLKIVQLTPTDKEYGDVKAKFLQTSGTPSIEFIKIERIQNKTLYQQFIAKKKLMDDTNPKSVQNEKSLWHGFSIDALNSITNYGFNRSYCGKNATALGAGVYFAVNVSYSINDTYSRPDASGHKRMFLCRVLTGEYCNGNSAIKVPPQKKSATGNHILYDTVTNDTNNPIMFVIFHDSQAYPEYLVEFKRK